MIISDENIDHWLNCNQQRNQSLWSKKTTTKNQKKTLIKWEAQAVVRDMWVIVGTENKLISHFKGFGIICYLQPRAKILFC